MKIFFLILSCFLIFGCSKKTEVGSDAELELNEVKPEAHEVSDRGLGVGAKAPQISTTDIDGKSFDLNQTLSASPVILVFYRGGWCPYCSLQLRKLQLEALPRIKNAGGKLVAISVDKPGRAVEMKKKENLGMTLLSDPRAKILKAYDVDFKVPDDLVEKYIKKYKIDLEAHSGEKHHIIAVPAVYVINKSGELTFSYVNENYKVRAQVEDILKAVESL